MVDDNDLNLKLAKRVLENLGAKVLVADGGQSALELINIHDFDLVFIDIHMPEMDGYELAVRIRKMQYNMPLIALSADAYEEAVLKSLQSGMNAHVKKPFTKEEIFVASKGFLEL